MIKLPWRSKRTIVDTQTWNFYDRRLPGGIAMVRYNVHKFDPNAYQYAFILKFFLPRHLVREERTRNAVEDGAVKTLQNANIDCKFMSVKTIVSENGANVELLFHAKDLDDATKAFERYIRDHAETHIECSNFNEQILPTADDMNRMGDRDVVNHLIKAGSDPLKPHSIEFAFFGEATNLERLRQKLLAEGYVQVEQDAHDDLVMAQTLSLDLETINDRTAYLMKLAREFGVKFDGWGAKVMK